VAEKVGEKVAERVAQRVATARAYRTLLGSQLRSQTSYRTSFWLDVLASVVVGIVEFVEVYVVFHNVPTLGGLDLTAAMLVFGLANLGFALGNVFAGQLDEVPTLIRLGTLDVLLLRPLSVLGQLVTSDVQLRRLGRAGVAVVLLAIALPRRDADWTPARLALLVVTPVAGAMLFAALFLAAGAVQFWLVEGAEFTYAFTYGASYAASFSPAVLSVPLRALFTFVVPAAFTAYLPALAILGRDGPPWLPGWLGWCTPAAAAVAWLVALGLWRHALLHYTGAGG
jgi:ABC-2 type transport system permease protein